jgi:hypothetical protein
MALTTTQCMTRVMNALRLPDTPSSEQYARVLALMNIVYRDIMGKYVWKWLEKRETFNTVAKYTSGTIDLTADSTFATLSAPSSVSLVGRKLTSPTSATDSNAVYRISTHAAGTSEIQFEGAYTGASQASVSFNIYKDEYPLATDSARVLFMSRFGWQTRFNIIRAEDMMIIKQSDVGEGQPMAAAIMDHVTTGDPTTQRTVMLHPYPDAAYRIETRYKQGGNAELSGSARPLIPDEWINVLIYGTLSRGYSIFHNDAQNSATYTALFNDVLNLMVAQQREYEGLPQYVPKDVHRRFYSRSRRMTPGEGDMGRFFDQM